MATGYAGRAFRQCHPDHSDFHETVRRNPRVLGRFHALGEFGALYVALSRETAEAELAREAERKGVALDQLAPRVMLALDVSVERVLDLTRPDVRREWDLTLDEVLGTDYRKCHEVARVARAEGYQAIRYPSATGIGDNLAVFYDLCLSESVREVGREFMEFGDIPQTPGRLAWLWRIIGK